MEQYDLIVIGAGPGGYVAAIRAAELGFKTAIVEKESLGGICLNFGCIPSKSLLKNAEIARTLRKDADSFGVSFSDLKLDYAAAVARSRKVSKRLNQGVAFLMKKNKIDVIPGKAVFNDANTITVTPDDGESAQFSAKHFILATGSHPVDMKGMEADGEKILNFRHAIVQNSLPKSIVIVGGGAIGVEFATVWNAYGVKVTIVEMQDHLLPNEDKAAGLELEKSFKKQGIIAKTCTSLKNVQKTDDGVIVTVSAGEQEEELTADQVLIAIGFRPNTEELGLAEAGVKLNARGWVETDAFGKTNSDAIYAIGDVTGKILLAHAASAMGRIAAEKIAGKEPTPLEIGLIPHATYSHPQVASFGLTEESAAKAGVNLRIGQAGFIANGKALGLNENEGWAKLLFDDASGKLVGAVMLGAEVCELLPELTLAAAHGMTAEDLLANVHAHPTLSECVWEAAEQAANAK